MHSSSEHIHGAHILDTSLQRDITLCCCAFGNAVTDDPNIDIDEPE
jgi:hypothetical protein